MHPHGENLQLIRRLAGWIERSHRAVPMYVACARGRSTNSPSPLLGVTFVEQGKYDWWRMGDWEYNIAGGQLGVAWAHHGSETSQPVKPVAMWSCVFNVGGVDEFDDLYTLYPDEPVRAKNAAAVTSAFRNLAQRFLLRDVEHPLKLKGALLSWLAVVMDEFGDRAVSGKVIPPGVVKARDYMEQSFSRADITLDDVARRAGLSNAHFGRVFREAMQISPKQYLQNLRLNHAATLLRQSNLRIGEVAAESGISDPLYFSRLFRDHYGCSPKAYRSR